MDRAELSHAARYDIELSRKYIPAKFKFVKLIETMIFPQKKTNICPTMTATQHARGRIEYYPPRGRPSLVTSITLRSFNFAPAK